MVLAPETNRVRKVSASMHRLLALLILAGLHSQTSAAHKRWANRTAEQRAAIMRKTNETRSRNARERRIAELIAKAPPLTAEQRARLAVLLNNHPEPVVAPPVDMRDSLTPEKRAEYQRQQADVAERRRQQREAADAQLNQQLADALARHDAEVIARHEAAKLAGSDVRARRDATSGRSEAASA